MAENKRESRIAGATGERRSSYSIGAKVTRAEHARLEAEWQARGCTQSELVRAALKLDDMPPMRPLLVAAGELIRAGNSHAEAARRREWKAGAVGLDQLNHHAVELIRLATEERTSR